VSTYSVIFGEGIVVNRRPIDGAENVVILVILSKLDLMDDE
jgi:hypothetical protein